MVIAVVIKFLLLYRSRYALAQCVKPVIDLLMPASSLGLRCIIENIESQGDDASFFLGFFPFPSEDLLTLIESGREAGP